MSGPALRIGRMMAPVQSLGPGRRLVLWLQGCTLACPGCVSPDLWDAEGGASWPVEELVRLFHSIEEPLDGLTDPESVFGSYGALAADPAFRFAT